MAKYVLAGKDIDRFFYIVRGDGNDAYVLIKSINGMLLFSFGNLNQISDIF